jgi:hypothetical protein
LAGALLEATCAIIVSILEQEIRTHYSAASLQAGLVGHFTLAPVGTAKNLLTNRNKQGGKLDTFE